MLLKVSLNVKQKKWGGVAVPFPWRQVGTIEHNVT